LVASGTDADGVGRRGEKRERHETKKETEKEKRKNGETTKTSLRYLKRASVLASGHTTNALTIV
jgi:hypothetical protein